MREYRMESPFVFTSSAYLPSKSVRVPSVVLRMMMLTKGRGSPVAESIMFPMILVSCGKAEKGRYRKINAHNNRRICNRENIKQISRIFFRASVIVQRSDDTFSKNVVKMQNPEVSVLVRNE